MHIVIMGGTGFIGRRLANALLSKGHAVSITSRKPERVQRMFSEQVAGIEYDYSRPETLANSFCPQTVVINLVGENIGAGLWSKEQKRRILESRINAGKALLEAVRIAEEKPLFVIQGSAVGCYGDTAQIVDERRGYGTGFLADVCRQWEASTAEIEELGIQRAIVRTGIVLGEGGALEKMLPVFRFGVGGPLGSGKQGFPWIHIDDEVGAIVHIAETQIGGPFNLVAPDVVTQKEFATALGRALSRPAFLPAPAFVLKILLGEMAKEMLLSGQFVSSSRLVESGYVFRYSSLSQALQQLV